MYPVDPKKKPSKRMEIIKGNNDDEDEGPEIKIYDRSVQIEEIIPLVIKKNRCSKEVPNLQISWVVIHQ